MQTQTNCSFACLSKETDHPTNAHEYRHHNTHQLVQLVWIKTMGEVSLNPFYQ